MTTDLIAALKDLTNLKNQAGGAWSQCVTDSPEATIVAEEAMADWEEAILVAKTGDIIAALGLLWEAKEIARGWGDCGYETKGVAILESLK